MPSFKLQQKSSSKPIAAVKKKHNAKKVEKGSSGGKNGDTVTARRQKRLERNRESARLSRRRRKQYLEVLEERVSQLSLEMDQGRRAHAAAAIETVLAKRRELLNSPHPVDPALALPALDTSLSRTKVQAKNEELNGIWCGLHHETEPTEGTALLLTNPRDARGQIES